MSSFEFKTDKCIEYLPRDPKTREVKDCRKESGQSIEPYGIPKLVTEYLEVNLLSNINIRGSMTLFNLVIQSFLRYIALHYYSHKSME